MTAAFHAKQQIRQLRDIDCGKRALVRLPKFLKLALPLGSRAGRMNTGDGPTVTYVRLRCRDTGQNGTAAHYVAAIVALALL